MSYNKVNDEIVNDQLGQWRNHHWPTNAPQCNPFWWPCWSASAMSSTLPDGGGPGLHSMPLDVAIRQVFARYHPGRQQGCMQKKTSIKSTIFATISLAVVMRRYDTTKHIAPWRGSKALTEATGCRHRASIAANNSVWTCIPWLFSSFFIVDPLQRGSKWHQDP